MINKCDDMDIMLTTLRSRRTLMQKSFSEAKKDYAKLCSTKSKLEEDISTLNDEAKVIFGKIIMGRLGPWLILLLIFLIVLAASKFSILSLSGITFGVVGISFFSVIIDKFIVYYKKKNSIKIQYEIDYEELMNMVEQLSIDLEKCKSDIVSSREKLNDIKSEINQMVGEINVRNSELRVSSRCEVIEPEMQVVPVYLGGRRISME